MSETSLIADVMSLERELGLIRLMVFNSPDLKDALEKWSAHHRRISQRSDLASKNDLKRKVEALGLYFEELRVGFVQQCEAATQTQDVA